MNELTFKRAKQLTFPLLKQDPGTSVFIKIVTEPSPGKKIEADKEPATVGRVIDLTTGEECEFIFPTVLLGVLKENYKDNIVGLSFEVEKSAELSGKGKNRYHTFKIYELATNANEPKAKQA